MGEVFAGRYRLERRLAETPAYSAIEAVDEDEDVAVELWLVREELMPTATQRDLVVRSALDMQTVEHPHLRVVRDAGLAQSQVYIAMEPAAVGGVRKRLATGRPSPDNDLVLYATSLTEALEAAHARAYVHGRMIPEDIVSVDGIIKVGGVGLWSDVELSAARRLWRPADRYLAPEVRESGQVSPAADVYSLAVLVLELASGAGDAPIHEATQALVVAHPRLADVLTPALSPAPRHRPSSVAELLRRIRQVLVDDKVPTSRREAAVPAPELFKGAALRRSEASLPASSRASLDDEPIEFDESNTDSGVGAEPRAPALRRHAGGELKSTLLGFDGAGAHGASGKAKRPDGPTTLAGYPAPTGDVLMGRPTEPMDVPPVAELPPSDDAVPDFKPSGSTDRLAMVAPAPGPREDRPKFVEAATTEATPEELAAQIAASRAGGKRGALPVRRKRRSTQSPLAEPIRKPKRPGTAPPSAVTLLEGTATAPPRFASAPPVPDVAEAPGEADDSEVVDDTRRDVSPAPEPSDADEDLDTAILELRAELAAEPGEITRETSPVSSSAFDRAETPRMLEQMEELERQETLVHQRRRRPLTSRDPELLQSLPLRPKDTEEPFSAVRLADFESALTEPRPAEKPDDKLEFVSARDKASDGRKTVAERTGRAIARPQGKLRTLADEADDARRNRRDLGAFAPPRAAGGTSTSAGMGWGAAAMIGLVLAVALAFTIWFGLRAWKAHSGAGTGLGIDASSVALPATTSIDAAPVVALELPQCPEGMVPVVPRSGTGIDAFCIDTHEAPGAGQMPTVGKSYDDALAACQERGARLCRPAEWVAACRGPEQATYPYGVAFAGDKCNVDRNNVREIVPGGSFAECVSASGAFDMSGNVSEWTEGRYTYGGSARDRSPGRCPERRRWPANDKGQADVGYRCCADPGGTAPTEADSLP